MRRRHLCIVIVLLSVSLTVATALLIVLFNNGSSRGFLAIVTGQEVNPKSCNVNAYFANELRRKDILFVADQSDFFSLSRQTVVEFLDYWSTAHTDSFRTELHGLSEISLILSLDTIALRRTTVYMESWDYQDIAEASHWQCRDFTTADLEFFWRLGNIRHRLNAANFQGDTVKRPNLNIVAIGTSAETCDEADSDNASRIALELINYQDIYPGRKILVFLDATYLYRLPQSSVNDVKLSTSVVERFEGAMEIGARLTTVAQADRSQWPFSFQTGIPDCDYVLPFSSLEKTAIQAELPESLRFDALILRTCPPDLHLPILSIPSMHVARTIVAEMPNLADSAGWSLWPALLTYLDAVSGATPLRVSFYDRTALRDACVQWQKWADTAQIHIVDEIVSLRLWNRLIDKIAGASDLVARHCDETLLSILPGAPVYDGRFAIPTKAERAAQLRGFLARNRDKVIVRMLVNLLWVGSPVEKSDALTALSRETGMQFNTASEWSQWYRSGQLEMW